jgi:plastocyanin
MKLVYLVSGLLLLALLAPASEVQGRATITKRLSKRSLSPIVYNLRGTATPWAEPDAEPVNEFDRMVVILEPTKDEREKTSGKDHRLLPPSPPVTEKLNQQDARFQPDVIVVPVGSTVEFPNLDPIFHNVFSLSKAQPFDLGYYPQGHSRNVKFNNPGVVQVYCHIHANMYAAIVVTDSPWYQKPAADGSFSFSNVPPGRYRLIAWHKVAGLHKVDVQVPETGSVDATIRVPVDTER